MTKRWFIVLLLLASLVVEAQSIRLNKYDAPTSLFLDGGTLYNYNRYEHSRFSLGLSCVTPNEHHDNNKSVLGQWTFAGYLAYGTGDHAFKYGTSAYLKLAGPRRQRFGISLYNDIERAASRKLSGYEMLSVNNNASYVSSRYSGVRGGVFRYEFYTDNCRQRVEMRLRQTWEDLRFDSIGLIYPARGDERGLVSCYTELGTRVNDYIHSLTLDLVAGRMSDTSTRHYLRGILLYKDSPGNIGLNLFGQLGFSTHNTPYSRMFDVSGSAYSYFFFNNTFITIRPNTFNTNLFATFCVNYTMPKPLWSLSWSSPRPFAQLNMMWGYLYHQDDCGRLLWDGLPLLSPYKGVLEPVVGIANLVRIGYVDYGAAVAYQLTPSSASYHNTDPSLNFAFTVVAKISI